MIIRHQSHEPAVVVDSKGDVHVFGPVKIIDAHEAEGYITGAASPAWPAIAPPERRFAGRGTGPIPG